MTTVAGHYAAPPAKPGWQPGAVTWPSGAADVDLSAAAAGAVPAAKLPVRLGRAGKAAVPPAAHVTVAPQQTSAKLGVRGVVLSVTPSGAGSMHVGLDYTAYRNAFGGDWGSRLRLVELPSCALTIPDKPECRTRKPVKSSNNAKAGTVGADVPMTAAQTTVLAADASSDAGSGGGDYSATSLQPSGSWQSGGAADSFTWSYPISMPQVPGGLTPQVALTYDSQAVDGLTSSTNNQASWIGDGWSYNPGYIERSYQSCHQNPDGPTKTSDRCWTDDTTLTLSLGGHTSTLVKDDNTGEYHPMSDSGERVQYVADGTNNGAQNGEHFVVTTTDGTQYFYGLNQLPGFDPNNKTDATTNSVLAEPVYATKSGQPCYNADFSQSHCQQAYRWNLDYVKDTHNDVISYFYTKESNSYAADNGTTATADYDRGSYLARIQYGQRDGQVYSTQPGAQVVFTSTGRCTQDTCDPGTLGADTAKQWPDVPYDLNCKSQASCQITAPTFWSEYTLQSIQTQVLVGTAETNVDQWTLKHSFPATGDSTQPALWLSSIARTGQDTSAGGSSAPIGLPAITFTGTPLSNRVNLASGYPPITRQRLTNVVTETGEKIAVTYSAPACGSGTLADPSQNTSLCFPDYWTPAGTPDPMLDWFNKFVVTDVVEQDPTGGAADDTIETKYTPVGNPAWHHNDNPLTPAAQRTWDQWRGFQGMTVTKGTAPDPVQKTQYTYFRGMNGDTLPNNASRSVSVSDTRGDPPVSDASQYAGLTYETVVYNGDAVVTDTITDPWSSGATATHALTGGLPAQQSFLVDKADTKVFTPLADGSTRETETDTTHDGRGRVIKVDDKGDVSTAADDLCTTTSYADNTGAWILDRKSEVATVSVNCGTTPSLPANAVSDKLTFYDGSTTLGAAPTTGDVTATQQATSYNGGTPVYATMSTTKVDQYGRPTASTDADNRETDTTYSPATGAAPTSVAVKDPMQFTTTTTYDPSRGLALAKTDAGGFTTSEQYDALGRLTGVQKPGVSGLSLKYTYTLSSDRPSVVDTYTLNFDGSYRVSETLYDSLLRAREIQTQTPDNGRTITDTVYNTDGLQSETTDPYYNSSPVDAALVQAQPGDVPSATGIAYDADGRKTSETAYALGNATWTTTYSYGGNSTTTVPPAGGTATTTITDARGHITDRYTYHAGVPADPVHDHAGDYDDTHYSWHPDGNQATVVDAAGNTWSYQYNLLGQQVSASDPDTGTSTNTYDNAGQLLTSTDARGAQTTTTYDADGRKTAKYDTTGGKATGPSDQIAAWTYDTLKKGYPTATTSYSGGDTYTQTVLAYNAMGTPQAKRTTLTGEGGTLIPAGGLVTTFGYSTTGYPTGENDAAAGGLPSENVQIGYDTFGQPTSLAGTIPTTSGVPSWTYVQAVGYSEFGKPLQYTMPAAGGNVWVTMAYDDQTHALTDVQTTDTKASTVVDDMTYRYSANGVSKGAGLITSTVDSQNGGAAVDAQCYSYDYATRLAGAWTATDNCAGGPSGSTVGGPDPYWQSWTYDAAGDRSGQVDHDVTGNAVNDTTTTYTYPTAAQQHTLSNTTATGPNAGTSSYAYDAAGNTTSITGGPTGNQTLTWNDQGKLATDATGAGTSSYVYDADGNLVVRRDPGQTTLFVGDEQLALNTAANTVSGTRYYTIGGATVAVRTSTGKNPQVLVPDHQGTDLLAIDTGTYGVTRRQFLPFGGTRGSAPSSWPGDKGYIGGTPDSTTQLENIGAREYDPATGRFLSPDPVLASDSPNQLGGYDYAGNDPVTGSDPTGMLMNCGPDGVLCGIRQQGQSDDEYQQERSYWQQYYKAHPPNPTPSYDSSSWTCGNNYGTGERTCSGINGGVAAASAPQAAADQIAQKVADAAKKMRTGETPEIRSDAAKVLNALRNNPGMKMISRAGKQEWVGDAGRVLLVVGAGYSFVSGYASAHDAGRTDDEALKIGATDAAVNTLAGWGGAEGGAWAGAAIGSAIAPGIGTLIGAGVGALVGSGLASWFSGYMDDFILDNNL